MPSLDSVQFSQSLLTSFFLSSLYSLIPKLLAAASTISEVQSPRISRYIENLYKHNPFQQWMAERSLAADVARARLRPLDSRNGEFLDQKATRALICPNRKWLAVSVVSVLLFTVANVLGALTIMWEESVSTDYDHGVVKYPAWPVTDGLKEMTLRGNCKWIRVAGSGDIDKAGFAIYQLCADVFKVNKTAGMRRNEVLAEEENGNYKLVFSLETLTQEGIDEHWKVSQKNEDSLEKARKPQSYLKDCSEDCQGEWRDKGIEHAIIQQALREVGMVERKVEHYIDSKEFRIEDVLKDRRSRLTTEAWMTMLFVTVVAILWTLVGLVKTEGETYFAIVTRMMREAAAYGPTSIATVLEPTTEGKASFLVAKQAGNEEVERKIKETADIQNSPATSLDSTRRKSSFRPLDVVKDIEQEEDANGVVLRVARYAYGKENEERARDGMIIVAYRLEEDDY